MAVGMGMIVDFDNSWDALVNPGESEVFFDADPGEIEALASDYSPVSGWWLAELSRLIYRRPRSGGTKGFQGRSRKEILAAAGMREVLFLNRRGTQCAVVEIPTISAPVWVLVFRGSLELRNWLSDFNFFYSSWTEGGRVHRGFKTALEEVWDDVAGCLAGFQGSLHITGHSLGAALATLAASRLRPQNLYVFGSPRVGNREFAATLAGGNVFRIENRRDLVTGVPPEMGSDPFVHVGELHYITHDQRMLADPEASAVREDRASIDPTFITAQSRRNWYDPPRCLRDHAPVNYVAHLERFLAGKE